MLELEEYLSKFSKITRVPTLERYRIPNGPTRKST